MKIRYGLMSGLVLCFLGSVVFGQAAVSPGAGGGMGGGVMGGAAPVVPVPSAAPTTRPAVEDALMPGGPFNGIALSDLLDYMKQYVSGFNAIVIRSPGAEPSYPTFDNFAPKNVTVGQFLDLVRTSYPGVDVQRIDGRMGPLYVFHVAAVQVAGAPAPGMPAATPFGGAPEGVNPDDLPPVVKVYSLATVVNTVANGGDTKKALNDVLSLLQTALDEQGGKNGAALKVHEPTEMLVFRGTVVQMGVLEQALTAMEPNANSEMEKMKRDYILEMKKQDMDQKNDQEKIADLQKRLEEATVRANQLQAGSESLKEQLQVLTAKDAANKPK